MSKMGGLVFEVQERIDNPEIPLHNIVEWLVEERHFSEAGAEDFVVGVMTLEG